MFRTKLQLSYPQNRTVQLSLRHAYASNFLPEPQHMHAQKTAMPIMLWQVAAKLTNLVEQVANDFDVHLVQILFIDAVGKITRYTTSALTISSALLENMHSKSSRQPKYQQQQFCHAILSTLQTLITVVIC